MDQLTLEIVRDLINSRNNFFRRPYVFRNRDNLANQFLQNEATFLELLSVISERRRSPITISFPLTGFGTAFSDPVPVLPSPLQISSEIETFLSPSVQTCSICQDQIVSDGVRLRTCQHVYHRSCVETWFHASVRCPVCRRDIREGPASQTSAVSTGTLPPQMYQWGGEDSQL